MEPHQGYFTADLAAIDPVVHDAIVEERKRQQNQIELIASENIVSRAVLEAQGSVLTNKTVEGYPGRRYHGGASNVDVIERVAIERACELFGCRFANVQPHSGTQANQTVFLSLLRPGDTVLSMDLKAGGHLSHGAAPNMSGKWFEVVHYGVRRQDGLIDMDEVAALADDHKPKLIIAGGSSYPRAIDFARFRRIADAVGATFLVDMAHFAGLEVGADLVGDRPEAGEVDDPRIGRAAGDDQLRLVLVGQALDLVEVDQAVLLAHAVLHGVEPFAREVRLGAVGQVPAGRERQAHDRVAGLQQRQHDALVGLRAGVRLDVDEAAVEQPLGALDRQALGDVDELAAAVVAAARIALGVLVGEQRALGLQHAQGDDVLRGDQLDLLLLAAQLVTDGFGKLRIAFGEAGGKEPPIEEFAGIC